MRHIHEFLRGKFGWYNRCHENTHTNALLWGAFLLVALFYTFGLVKVIGSTIAEVGLDTQLTAVAASVAGRSEASTVLERLIAANNVALSRANEHARASTNSAATKLEDLKSALRDRQAVIRELALTDPKEVRRFIFDAQSIASIPEAARDLVEDPVTVSGTFKVMIAEAPGENEGAYEEYLLEVSPTKHYRLALAEDEAIDLEPESALSVTGGVLGDDLIIPTSYEPMEGEETVLGASTVKKVAVIAFNFRNNTAQPIVPDEIRARVFTNANSVNAYYREVSNGTWVIEGRDRVDGDVYGWVTIDADNGTGVCDYNVWSQLAQQKLTSMGVNLTGYTNIQYVFPGANTNCSWIGLASLGGGNSWVKVESLSTWVSGHELGHNFGFHHAATYGCTVANSGAGCVSSEYGDNQDIMGSAARHTNNYNKSKYWIPSAQFVTAATPGSYLLEPTETVSGGVKAIRIPRPFTVDGRVVSDGYYMLEFRTAAGVFDTYALTDPYVNGVTVRLVSGNYPGGGYRTYRVTTIPQGGTFTDAEGGVTISVGTVTAAGAPVTVAMPTVACAHTAPLVSLTPSAQWGAAGNSLSYTISVKNQDTASCGTSTFTVTPMLPTGFAQSPSTLSFSLAPGAQQSASFAVSAPVTAVPASYIITQAVVGTEAIAQQGSASANFNIAGTDVTPPLVTITSPTGSSTLSGNRISVSASATDASGIAKMELSIDGKVVKTCNSGASSCSYTWNLAKAAVGYHTISAAAIDRSAQMNRGETQLVVTK